MSLKGGKGMAKGVLSLCFMAVIFGVGCVHTAESVPELKCRADEVLKQENVSARAHVDVVFELVDRLLAEKKDNEAEPYLIQGLKLFPWNLRYQMCYAELLQNKGEQKQAEEKAALVLENGESDELVGRARRLLKLPQLQDFPALCRVEGTNACIVLLPFPSCDQWLVSCLRDKLAAELKVPVFVQTAQIRDFTFSRDRRQKVVEGMRNQLMKNVGDEKVVEGMKELGLTENDLEKDEPVTNLMRLLVAGSGKMSAQEFDAFLRDAEGQDPQWDAGQMLALLTRTVETCRRKSVAYIGLTPHDIYAKDYNFVFGWSGPQGAIVSYRRFAADFKQDVPNQARLVKRTLMQCLSSAGFVYGIERCTDPTCARAYPNSLSEHDAKKGTLCSECKKKFVAVFGQAE